MGVDSSDASRGARPALDDVTNEMGKKRGNLSIYVSPSKGNGERVCKENDKENICSGVENYKVPKRVPLGAKTQAVERPKIFDKEKSDCFGKQVLGGVENRQVRKIYDVGKETKASFVKRVPLRLDFHQAKGNNVVGNVKALSAKQIPLKVNDVASGVPRHVDKGSDHLSLKRVRSEVVDLEVEKSPMPKGAKTIGDSGLCPLKGGKAYRLQSHGGSPFSPESARVGIEETTPETNKRSVFAEGSSVPRRGEVPDNAVQERNKGCIPIISLDDSPSPSNRILIEDGRKCRGDEGKDLTEVAQSGTTKEPSQASEAHGRSPGSSYLSYSISGSVIGPRLTEFQHGKPFELTRCSLLKDDGCFSSGAGCDSIKGCSCSFCAKAAYIWSDLYYQDVKGRITASMKSRQEASDLVKKIEQNEILQLGLGSSSKSSSSDAEKIMNQWKSLFRSMENTFAKEANQLEPKFLALKELRENCKMNLEATNGEPVKTRPWFSDASTDHMDAR
ncbi:hypothetical protein Droror1_Dr00018303 [Drosera rotundifolia]